MDLTKSLIVDCSTLPTSIIIVGVGNADFSLMEELDGDGGLLTDRKGRRCHRDIVQFVRFNESVQKGDLAEQVLKEIPEQLCSYMEQKGFKPVPVQPDMSLYQVQAQASAAEQLVGHHLGNAMVQNAAQNAVMQGMAQMNM